MQKVPDLSKSNDRLFSKKKDEEQDPVKNAFKKSKGPTPVPTSANTPLGKQTPPTPTPHQLDDSFQNLQSTAMISGEDEFDNLPSQFTSNILEQSVCTKGAYEIVGKLDSFMPEEQITTEAEVFEFLKSHLDPESFSCQAIRLDDRRRFVHLVFYNQVPLGMRALLQLVLSGAHPMRENVDKDFPDYKGLKKGQGFNTSSNKPDKPPPTFVPFLQLCENICGKYHLDIPKISFEIFNEIVAKHKLQNAFELKHLIVPLVIGFKKSIDNLKQQANKQSKDGNKSEQNYYKQLWDLYSKNYLSYYTKKGFKYPEEICMRLLAEELIEHTDYLSCFKQNAEKSKLISTTVDYLRLESLLSPNSTPPKEVITPMLTMYKSVFGMTKNINYVHSEQLIDYFVVLMDKTMPLLLVSFWARDRSTWMEYGGWKQQPNIVMSYLYNMCKHVREVDVSDYVSIKLLEYALDGDFMPTNNGWLQ